MAEGNLKPGFYRVELNRTIWEVPTRYHNLQPVGSGAYGQVCSAVDNKLDMKVAIKKLARPFQSAIHAKRTYREVRMLKHMNHENVIGLLDVFTPATTLENFDDVYLVTHLMGADLNNIVRTQRLSDDHVQFLVYQILRGLKYVHSAGILHRDLKPSNIAVNEDCELKILDFGLARQADDEMTGYVATRWYRAPEIMLNWMHYNQTVDIWSVGCIMAELMTGKTLFPGTDHIDQLTSIMCLVGTPEKSLMQKITSDEVDQLKRTMNLVGTPTADLLAKIKSDEARRYIQSLAVMKKKDFKKVFDGANPLAIDLLERMLDLDPDTRITAEGALAHPYLAQYADPDDEPICELYDQSFEEKELEIPTWKKMVFEKMLEFSEPKPKVKTCGFKMDNMEEVQRSMPRTPSPTSGNTWSGGVVVAATRAMYPAGSPDHKGSWSPQGTWSSSNRPARPRTPDDYTGLRRSPGRRRSSTGSRGIYSHHHDNSDEETDDLTAYAIPVPARGPRSFFPR